MSTNAMILAAGRGERMRPLTDTVPKPLAPLAGKPLIQYHIERLAAAGIEHIVINVAWLGTQIEKSVGNGERFGVRISYSNEGDTALDTGGGIFRVLPLLGDAPFWVVSADLWTEIPFGDSSRLAEADLAHLIMVDNPDFHPRGDFYFHEGRVYDVEPDVKRSGISDATCDAISGSKRMTYASVALLRPQLFAGCTPGVFSVVPLLRAAMAAGRVSGERFTGRWHNIGTLAQLSAVEQTLSRAYPS
jgi:N-acetyl-alpha-D-muramate 1-phosphate uridylyltransferase